LYISYTLALLTWIYGILLVNLGVSSVGFFGVRGFGFAAEVFYGTLAYRAAALLLFSGCSVLSVMWTGKAISALYTVAMLYALPAAVLLCFEKMLFHFYPCVNTENSLLKFLSVENSFIFEPFNLKRTADATTYITLALALLCFVLAGIRYVRRGSEEAEKFSSAVGLRVLQRCVLPFVFALVGVYYIAVDDTAKEGICFIILAALALFVYELLVTKRVKSAINAMPWMLAVAVLSVAVAGAAHLTADTMKGNDPESAVEVESVTITVKGDKNIHYYKPIENIKDYEVISWVIEEIEEEKSYRSTKSTVVLKLKNGKTLIRLVNLANTETLQRYMMSTPEINEQIYTLPKVAYFENEKQKELWDIFTEEYYALPFGTRCRLNEVVGDGRRASFSMKVVNYANDVVTQTYVIDSYVAPNTYRFVLENGMWADVWW